MKNEKSNGQANNGKNQKTFVREWRDDKVFKNEELGIGVKLTRSNDRFPLFRQELVEIMQDGKTFSRMRVHSTGHRSGKVAIPDIGSAISTLFDQAREYMYEILQRSEDEWIEFSKGREDRGPKKPLGIKALGKRDHERRQQDPQSRGG